MSYQSELEEEYTRLQKLQYSVHVNNIKKYISEVRRLWKPTTKEIEGQVYHGNRQGDVELLTLYWDEYRCNWTSKEIAFEGYLFKNIRDIDQKDKIEKYKEKRNT
ncbi:hypothetical protein [Sphingobacterium daejeonense]|uniref:hypothetical protein n=1 Tax=Sphingobacterium daejeonense TaxID=371142 RepID=UPI0010C325F5|nr:hypothetical protein [Sphingobacterium daejeonense]VTQ01808.1 Uncharacterised protein [Sphingobacterium daejeonense]